MLSVILARWASEDVGFYLLAWHLSEPGFTKFSNCCSVCSACWDLISLMFYILHLKTYVFYITFVNLNCLVLYIVSLFFKT